LLPQQSHSEQGAEASSAGLSFSTISTPFRGSPGTFQDLRNTRRWWPRAVGLVSLLVFEYFLYHNLHAKISQWCLAFVLSFFVLSFPELKSRIPTIRRTSCLVPVSLRYLLFHICALAIVLAVPSPFPAEYRLLIAVIWLWAGICTLFFAGAAFFPKDVWRYLFRASGPAWIYAAATASLALALEPALWSIWTSSTGTFGVDLTFWMVARILHPFIAVVFTDWRQHIIGSDRFAVEIGGGCSGWEGLGLVAMFTILSLWLSRREYRFPAALILIPTAMTLTFALNSVRIAALILIGHHGFPDIAIGGFHSMAGWIAFSGVALGVSLVGPRITWLRTAQAESQLLSHQTFSNPAVPFLLPFAGILAAGMISMAAAAQFEWLYPLRFLVALAAFWYCRRDYASIPRWRPGWLPVLAGAVVFVVWIAFDRSSHPDNGIAAGLASMPAPARITWLSLRTLAAISTVPLAEELAFRGFLLRRIVSPEFESVDFGSWSYIAISVSSFVFGLLHGDRWIVGTIAGAIYAIAMVRRRNLWDAFVAHAVTNAMLAAWVLVGGKWYYW
jgi:exosortase E/protease (VPEID-CTERM system)